MVADGVAFTKGRAMAGGAGGGGGGRRGTCARGGKERLAVAQKKKTEHEPDKKKKSKSKKENGEKTESSPKVKAGKDPNSRGGVERADAAESPLAAEGTPGGGGGRWIHVT